MRSDIHVDGWQNQSQRMKAPVNDAYARLNVGGSLLITGKGVPSGLRKRQGFIPAALNVHYN
jgi:hypothetical protein